jgi:UDP-N-acetylglucosamine enolpyruvyl transferase
VVNSSAGTITINGTPTAAGTASFDVSATDSHGGTFTHTYTITVNPAVTLSPATLPGGEVGFSYSQMITTSGGTGTVTLALSNVSNSSGLTIGGGGTGTIAVSGTPTTAGTVSFTVTPSDANGAGTPKTYTFNVAAAMATTPATLPNGQVGVSYNQTITATGGSGTVTLALSNVVNPTGLTISGTGTGTITVSGTPTAAGTVSFDVTPSDSIGTGATKHYTFNVLAA